MALLQMLAGSGESPAVTRSKKKLLGDLGIGNTAPPPMTPEEARALAMLNTPSDQGGQADSVNAAANALAGLAKKPEGGQSTFDILKGFLNPSTTPTNVVPQTVGDAGTAAAAVPPTLEQGGPNPVIAALQNAAAINQLGQTAAGLPQVPVAGSTPGLVPPEMQGPPQPTAMDLFRAANREQLGMPGGLPPSGSASPGTVPGAGVPLPPPRPDFPVQDPMAPEQYRQSPVGTPPGIGMADRDNPVAGEQVGGLWSALRRMIPEGSPAAATIDMLSGMKVPGMPDLAALAERYKANAAASGGSPEGQSAFQAGPFKDNGPAVPGNKAAGDPSTAQTGPAPAFKYRFGGPAGGVPSQATGQTRELNINPDGSMTSGIVPPTYINKVSNAESSNDPNAKNPNSSASGQFQFTDGTWKDTVREYDPETYRARKGDVLDLKNDPKYQKQMAEKFTNGNAEILQSNKLPVTEGNLYAMHFFGRGAGPKVLKASDDAPVEQFVSDDALKANSFLKGKTVGWAKQWAENTINKKGTQVSANGGSGAGGAFGMPGTPDLTAPQLPMPPTLKGPVGVDYTKMLELLAQAKPQGQAPLSTTEKALNIIAGLAGGAANGRAGDWGSVLAGMGAGAARGGVANLAGNRQMTKEDQAALSQYLEQSARVYGHTAESEANTKNAGVKTENENALNIFNRNVDQAKLDAQTRNKLNELKYSVDWKAWELGQPQVHATDSGINIVTKKPDGGINIKTQTFKDFDKQWTQLKSMGDVLGKDNPEVQAHIYAQMGQQPGGDIYARRGMLNDLVEKGGVRQALGDDTFKQLEKQVDKDIPKTLLATDPKGYQTKKDARMVDLLFQEMMAGRLPDTWIEQLAKQGHPGAMMLVQGAGS